MKRFKRIITGIAPQLLICATLAFTASGQILNELEVDPPVDVGDRCQYVEILGTPGGTVPSNTYFISINSDADNFGFLNVAVNISGATYGSNGTITLLNSLQGACPNRTFDPGTTIVNYSTITSLGQGSEGFYVVQSQNALVTGTDLDTNDNGIVDPLDSGASALKSSKPTKTGIGANFVFVDGINFVFNPDEQFIYGPAPNLVETLFGDVPDAATRFPGNNSPNMASAWYSGEMAASPEETTTYAAPLSVNFPMGGMLTPGASNVPAQAITGNGRADFDGDGRTDVSVFRPSEGNWYINGSSNGFSVLKFGLTGDTPVPGDFDGDGKADTAIFRPTNDAGSPDFWILNSNGFTASAGIWGSPGDVPVVADYDGDDKDDIAVFRPSTGDWYILKSGGGITITNFGTASDTPVSGDFDGDGMADLATYNAGVWMHILSGGGTPTINNGTAGDIPAAGDFDGDGKTDQATFRPSNGSWYIWQSSSGSQVVVQFGTSGDVPVPGDYDGDGQDDVAIYRNGVWWINQSTNGLAVTSFGLSSDTPAPNKANP